MNDLDQTIREALGEENLELFNKYGEPSIQQMVVDSFRGRTKWLVAITFVGILIFFVLSIVSVVQFIQAQELHKMIMWAVAFVFCLLAVSMMKIWYWMELNKNSIMREVKRVEFQIACLVQLYRGGGGRPPRE